MAKKDLLVKLWDVIDNQKGLDTDDKATMREKLEEHVAAIAPAWLKTGEIKVAGMPGVRVQPDGMSFRQDVELEFDLKAETIKVLIEWTKKRVKEYIGD